jgi:hypothetical protein
MKLVDPLMGYRAISGILIFQFALLIAMSYLLIVGHLKFKDMDNTILVIFISHLMNSLVDFLRLFCRNYLLGKRIFVYTINLVSVLYF